MKLSKLTLLTLSIIFIPNLLYHLDIFSSLSYGLIAICILIIAISKKEKACPHALNFKILFLIITILLLLNLPSVTIFSSLGLKYTYSIFGLYIFMASALLYAINLQKNKKYIANLILLITYIISSCAIFESLDLLQIKTDIKSIFPFNEPSHYALSLGPFIFTLMFLNTRLIFKITPVVINFFISLGIQNLTLMIIVLICILTLITRHKKSIIFFIALLPLLFFINYNSFESYINYVYERIDFSPDSTNTSALVYMQGYHLILEVLEKTNGIGLGFNLLGDFIPNNDYSNSLHSLNGSYTNINDGGILISKLVCELGWIGILSFIYYIFIIIRNFNKVRSFNLTPYQATATGFILSGLIDLFIRTTGYFTPSVFFLSVGIFLILNKKDENNSKY
jgi:hypothetical protein